MGRLQFLERLAFGRSAFQDLRRDDQTSTESFALAYNDQQPVLRITTQQYDEKGRPTNPATEARNQAERNAQNAAYALVGVVESKKVSIQKQEALLYDLRQAQIKLLEAEQDRGEDFDLVAPIMNTLVTWWPETLIQQVQVGMFAASMSFIEIVATELYTARLGGLHGLSAMLLRGLPAWTLLYVLRTLVRAGVAEAVGHLQETLNQRVSRKMLRKVNSCILMGYEMTLAAVDIALLPLQYSAFSQSLGLAPAWPLLPTWRLLLPLSSSFARSALWTPTYGDSPLARFTSPAALMLLKNWLERDHTDCLPIASQLTTFEYPSVSTPAKIAGRWRHDVHRDPLEKLYFRFYLARAKLMSWFGWNLESVALLPGLSTRYQNNFDPRDYDPREKLVKTEPRYRSTSLALQPVQFAADRVDDIFTRLSMLPLDSLVLRAITQAYLSSEFPMAAQAMKVAPHLHLPFGGGPFGTLWLQGTCGATWCALRDYVSKLGLSLALNYSAEVGVFFVLYKLCRWQGVRNFAWSEDDTERGRRLLDSLTCASRPGPDCRPPSFSSDEEASVDPAAE